MPQRVPNKFQHKRELHQKRVRNCFFHNLGMLKVLCAQSGFTMLRLYTRVGSCWHVWTKDGGTVLYAEAFARSSLLWANGVALVGIALLGRFREED